MVKTPHHPPVKIQNYFLVKKSLPIFLCGFFRETTTLQLKYRLELHAFSFIFCKLLTGNGVSVHVVDQIDKSQDG